MHHSILSIIAKIDLIKVLHLNDGIELIPCEYDDVSQYSNCDPLCTHTHEKVQVVLILMKKYYYNYRVGVLILMKKYWSTTIELEHSYS